jgi:hypothetical protein
LGYLRACSPVQLGGPFGFCAFALLSELLLGSLEIALKRTRPRQRIFYVGRYSMTEGGGCQEGKQTVLLSCPICVLNTALPSPLIRLNYDL